MGPLRKKSKQNHPKVADPSPALETKPVQESPANIGHPTTKPGSTSPVNGKNGQFQVDINTPVKGKKKDSRTDTSSTKSLRSTTSWYGGTWPRLQKSMAPTEVARESILADKPYHGIAAADLSRFEPRKPSNSDGRPPSMLLGKSKETLDITMGGTLEAGKGSETIVQAGQESLSSVAKEDPEAGPSTQAPETVESPQVPESNTVQRPATASGWLGWLGRPDGYKPVNTNEELSQSTADTALEIQDGFTKQKPTTESPAPLPSDEISKPSTTAVTSSSWFGFWSSAEPSATLLAPEDEIPVKTIVEPPDVAITDAPVDKNSTPAQGSTWAFWYSADTTKKNSKFPDAAKSTGELAVAGEPSENKPVPAQTKTGKNDKTNDNKNKSGKRGRPDSTELDEASRKAAAQLAPLTTVTPTPSLAPTKTTPPNILIPSVRTTYHLMENPSILQQLARILQLGQQRHVKHVFLTKEVPKIKKALAIGVHGLFPAPLLRTVIGQPTGTSIRFANHASAALRRWADQHGNANCEIEKVALEGEGRIADRVDNLWKLLLNWIDHIRSADFILVACHSQGVPVSLMLIAKLIEFGVVTSARIGVCAMAGVSLGPFPDYKSRLFSGSAGELFDFADPESTVSKRYEDALRTVLKYGVRVMYCGSIDDQLISMESSTFSTVSHPYIYRAVFIDGRIHAPDFIAHLVGFALKLRNLGVSDHGLIRELSAPLAGSLYTGEGHSRLYDDERVYDLAIEFALETTSVGDVALDVKKYEIPSNANPFILPWIMRGLLEEEFVKTELSNETEELLKQFDDWKPSTKVLKDVKYRLEAVRSKL